MTVGEEKVGYCTYKIKVGKLLFFLLVVSNKSIFLKVKLKLDTFIWQIVFEQWTGLQSASMIQSLVTTTRPLYQTANGTYTLYFAQCGTNTVKGV